MAEHYKPVKYKQWELTLEERFQEYHPPLTDREAVLEANRCLYCHDAPCMVACPTHIDIPTFIKKIATENTKGSARTILQANLLGATCSRVCPVEELCEGACVLEHEHKPIIIGRLQRYAMDYAASKKLKFFHPGKPNGYKVAVVGTGPAGLSCAGELAKLGFDVTCYEKKEMAGGLDTYGIVVFREPVEVSLSEVRMIQDMGVKIKTNTTIGVDVTMEELIENNDAVFVGVGLGSVPDMSIPGETLPGVVDGLEFIEETKVRKLNEITFGQRVVIIGAGNTGIDCATIARRLGSERVTIVYRRSEAEMPAYHFEYQFALGEGVTFMFMIQPVEVVGEGKVEGLKCVRMDLGEPDQSGRRRPVRASGAEEFVLPCDMVIKAIGQKKHTEMFSKLAEHGVKTTSNGYIAVDFETNRTDNPKVYAGGDCIRSKGEASTVSAVQDGKIAAAAIHQQLTGTPSPNEKHIEPVLSPVMK